MEFRTKIPIKQAEPKIDYESKLFLIGSCFVENIGKKLDFYKLQHLQNPFGILFHPLAIAKFFQKIAENSSYTKKDVFQHQERWHCFAAHSSLSNPNAEVLLENLNSALQNAREFLQRSSHLVITLGTAWSYFHLKTEQSVANCHKIPQKFFRKELQSSEEIQRSLQGILEDLKQINPNIEIIFTVSPVRHIKDGFVENQRSKAHLISAVHQINEENENTHYFPSYELMMDELRDYRFYAEDMLHPSQTAIDYIWKRFTETWFSEASFSILKEVENIQKGLSHRPFNRNSEAHLRFLEKLKSQISTLHKRYPHLRF
ncbi:GSCFA domain-containing protein [Salegentibacter sp. JZCK2]|uniref:GSCFA domain-containing protein n=1 Tax=Salegentibacter tibetensis TaxID=2873600 RepID=UPI001CCA9174|nr:GSCFA domain-containing protein [Salegentibacter tibetensis]MBZ9730812.1 GSCFA domain-containing protein [Salegentibacter tibetensis]